MERYGEWEDGRRGLETNIPIYIYIYILPIYIYILYICKCYYRTIYNCTTIYFYAHMYY